MKGPIPTQGAPNIPQINVGHAGTGILLDAEQRRGRQLLLLIFAGWGFIEGGLTAFSLLGQNIENMLTSIVRLCLSVALGYAVWIGQRWARHLMLGLLILTGILCFFSLVLSPSVVMFLLAALIVTAGLTLGLSNSIGSFLAFQRARRNPAAAGKER